MPQLRRRLFRDPSAKTPVSDDNCGSGDGAGINRTSQSRHTVDQGISQTKFNEWVYPLSGGVRKSQLKHAEA